MRVKLGNTHEKSSMFSTKKAIKKLYLLLLLKYAQMMKIVND